MITVIAVVHILVAIALILIVLLQTGRGSEIGAAFGGGSSQTLFGSSGSSGFMTKLTTGAIIVFMLTSLSLAFIYGHRESTVRNVPVKAGENVPAAPAQPQPQK
ncbi:MAG TPA: preprotein translocase subunit SecG [Syntrophorhabdaceae bacterium]|nr:preprotein translocase subunit SecG [Syntrophorhabdaceae bacterium]